MANAPSAPSSAPSKGGSGKPKLTRVLSVPDMIVYGLIFMVPIAPFGIYGGVFTESGGMPALVYVVGTLAMVFTALSYGMLIREWPVSGSVYAYTSRGLGKGIGFVSGWTLLLDYLLIPVLMYVVASTALSGIVPEVPPWAFSIVFVVANTFVNIRGIALTDIVNRIALVLEVLVLAVFVVLGVRWLLSDPASHGFTLQPLYNPSTFSLPLVFSAVSLGVLSFLGFDGIATLSEEAKDGRRGPGRAMMASLAIVGALFVLQTYIAGCISPDGAVFARRPGQRLLLGGPGGGRAVALRGVRRGHGAGLGHLHGAGRADGRVAHPLRHGARRRRCRTRSRAGAVPKYQTPYVAHAVRGRRSRLVLVLTFGQLGTDTISLFVNFGALTAFLLLHVTVIWLLLREEARRALGGAPAGAAVPAWRSSASRGWGSTCPAKVLGVRVDGRGDGLLPRAAFRAPKREVTLGG